ncbi:GNAT family N-acetyltransferase [Zoogloea sp. LCSB751]|uniref:GNAT family N-acetyltransferase n=1 Tax=Zoogloea sp. LCSB751 TaxID=1965277 RepID=UPI0009A4AAA3|nr:GNAT family protein [Zoogloea sp. LCSB751]
MNNFPTITTPRLILRDFNETDAAAIFELFSDDRVTEFYDFGTFSNVEQANKLIAANIRRNAVQDGSSLRWAICLADTPERVIGSCGFHSTNRNFHSIEIGYDLRPDHWGNGYAFEAVSQMLSFCFSSHIPFHVNRVSATTDLDSRKSIALLKRIGFSEEGVLRQYGFWKNQFHDVRLFSFLREEWEKNERFT